ncbi:type II secretion system F family protein [Limnohabitans sp.]|uniref:type II secretion system F family protein n=1 Tax=Limnohabitans sp. TaxID=1907725 RepID=UPI0025C41DF5|nr:type II secretion system F family protein [Limnohabitans sp.]
MNTPFWTIAVLAALSISALVWGLYGLWRQHLDPRQKALAQRLQAATLNGPSDEAEPTLKLRPKRLLSQWEWAERGLQTVPGATQFDHFLLQTGLALSLAQALSLAAVLVLLALALGASLHWPVLLSLVVATLGPLLLIAFLQHRRTHRMALISQALPDALDLMARSMQAGHAFTSALQVAAKDAPPPLSHELRTVFEEINFGISAAQALQGLALRVASDDVRYFVVAVIIQSETGGNLAEILKNTAYLIRERQKIAGIVRVLSAEGRISAIILSLLPFALAALMGLLNPGFISRLWTDPMGLQLVYTSLTLMAIGILWMWRLIQIRV